MQMKYILLKVSDTYQDFIKYLRSNSLANIVNEFTRKSFCTKISFKKWTNVSLLIICLS